MLYNKQKPVETGFQKYEVSPMSNFYDEKIETMSRDEMSQLQSERLVSMVERCYNNVPLYKKRFDEMGILPGDIKTIEDLKKL